MEQSEYRVRKHHRRISSTGGGRAWTEEEESYLLRTRMHKMPYKHIAAHLKKTELACRLHYHQMSYGNNSRRRSDSVSSTGSFYSIPEASDKTFHTQLSPVISPSSSPEPSSRPKASSSSPTRQAPRAHVPILPKPEATHIPLTLEPSPSTEHARPDNFCANSTYHYQREEESPINHTRLLVIYETHAEQFWAKIAAEYSHDTREASAKAVEGAVIRSLSQGLLGRANTLPLTPPNASPEASPEPQRYECGAPAMTSVNRGFCAVNESKTECAGGATSTELESTRRNLAARCSVSALLTVEKEVRPSSQ